MRVSIGLGTAGVPPTEAAAYGFPYFDEAFVATSQTLAENLKKSLMNRPEVTLTLQQGGQHQPKCWSERFGPAVSFLLPPETGRNKGALRADRKTVSAQISGCVAASTIGSHPCKCEENHKRNERPKLNRSQENARNPLQSPRARYRLR
jgi:hypothetical protein